MSSKLLTLALASLILFNSCFANASLITHSGYTLDTQTNIVSGDRLEWLQWDETAGLTVEQVLNEYDDWSLANGSQMAQLFSNLFPQYSWMTDENIHQSKYGSFGDDNTHINFVELFGATYIVPDERKELYFEEYSVTSAYFGSDDDQDGNINAAYVRDDYGFVGSGWEVGPVSELSSDWVALADQVGESRYGVALVRSIDSGTSNNTLTVPEPYSLAIFALGLLALSFRRLVR